MSWGRDRADGLGPCFAASASNFCAFSENDGCCGDEEDEVDEAGRCELLGVDYNGEKPEIYLTHSESENARMQFGSSDKPIFLIQTNGGPMGPDRAPMSWVRDAPLPNVLEMIEPFFDKYDET